MLHEHTIDPITPAELLQVEDNMLKWVVLQRIDVHEQRREDDKVWLLALCGSALGLLLFVALVMMDRGLPW